MKRLALILLILGAIGVFFSCQKDSPVKPEAQQDEQDMAELKDDVSFTGISSMVELLNPGVTTVLPNGMTRTTGMIAEWYDDANPDDPYYTGQTIWYENWLIYPDGQKAKIWGKMDFNLDDGLGTWKCSWHGYMYAYEGYDLRDPFVPCTIECVVVGQGKSGEVKGMVFKADYEMDFNGDFSTFFWSFEGEYH